MNSFHRRKVDIESTTDKPETQPSIGGEETKRINGLGSGTVRTSGISDSANRYASASVFQRARSAVPFGRK